mgnify:CR=1 FL=1
MKNHRLAQVFGLALLATVAAGCSSPTANSGVAGQTVLSGVQDGKAPSATQTFSLYFICSKCANDPAYPGKAVGVTVDMTVRSQQGILYEMNTDTRGKVTFTIPGGQQYIDIETQGTGIYCSWKSGVLYPNGFPVPWSSRSNTFDIPYSGSNCQ